MKQTPQHAPMHQFKVVNNQIMVGGMPITQLTERVGQTPYFAYDRQLLTKRVHDLKSVLPDSIRLHYAIKANPMPALVQHMSTLVDGFDLASGGEMRVALDTPMPASKISFAGPGKSIRDLRCAIAAGVTINVESPNELGRINSQGDSLGIRPKVAIRVNPDFELKSSGMKMSGGSKQFGIDAEEIPGILTSVHDYELEFQGFHIFSGSQNLNPNAIIEAQTKTFELAIRLAEYAPGPIKKLNIGGGFGIPYFPGETWLDIAPIGEHLNTRLPTVYSALGEVNVIIELGRYLVGDSGIYVSRIIDRKLSRNQVFLIADGGLHHHLAASGNFGQVIRKNYPVSMGNKADSTDLEVASVVGPLCTPLDLLADKMLLPKAEVGDLVVIFQSGAYGFSASPTQFLSHPPPIEVLV